MKLTLVAATGATGRHVLEQAVAAGHDVTALVRSPGKLTADVRAVRADLADPDPGALDSAVAGADAVVSALGATSKAEAGVASRGTAALVAAMARCGTRRLVVLSAAPIGTVPSPARPHKPRHDPGDGPVLRLAARIVKGVFKDHYADLAVMEDAVIDSGLDWTIVRPPRLTDAAARGSWRTAYGRNPPRALAIGRADLAACMLAQAGDADSAGRVVGVAY